jgi:hypothetical protein
VAGSCEYGDEPSGSGAMELVKERDVRAKENSFARTLHQQQQTVGLIYTGFRKLHMCRLTRRSKALQIRCGL